MERHEEEHCNELEYDGMEYEMFKNELDEEKHIKKRLVIKIWSSKINMKTIEICCAEWLMVKLIACI